MWLTRNMMCSFGTNTAHSNLYIYVKLLLGFKDRPMKNKMCFSKPWKLLTISSSAPNALSYVAHYAPAMLLSIISSKGSPRRNHSLTRALSISQECLTTILHLSPIYPSGICLAIICSDRTSQIYKLD